MSTKTWLLIIVILFIIANFIVYPGYNLMFWALPVWLWVNMLIVLAVYVVNRLFARRLERKGE